MQYYSFIYSLSLVSILWASALTACSLVVGWDLLFRGDTTTIFAVDMKQLQKSACYVCCGGSEGQEVKGNVDL
jgi:hypothetical protein